MLYKDWIGDDRIIKMCAILFIHTKMASPSCQEETQLSKEPASASTIGRCFIL